MVAAASGTLSWRQSFIGHGDVFSLIVPSCDSECGEGLTSRLQLMDATHEAWTSWEEIRLSENGMKLPGAGDKKCIESGMKVIPKF